jgi:hypothetical protein
MATTFVVSAGDYIVPFRKVTFRRYPVHISQTVLLGSILKLAGAGFENRVILSTDATTSGIVGVAVEAITTSGTHDPNTDQVLVALATPEAEFLASTVAARAVDFTDIGVRIETQIDATNGITRLNAAGVTNETVWTMSYLDPITRTTQATEGDTNAKGVFRFIPGATIWGVGTVLA